MTVAGTVFLQTTDFIDACYIVAFGTINIIGGFFVTDRMLSMFKAKPALPKAEDEDGEAPQ